VDGNGLQFAKEKHLTYLSKGSFTQPILNLKIADH
jgi:hypothetical protein